MSKLPKARYRKALFPRLREIRAQELGWEVTEIVKRLPGQKPGAASIYRLEQGIGIRIPNARRVFDVVNAALNNTLDPEKELKVK